MKGGKIGSRLLSFALCVLIALLLIKLGLTVMGALRPAPGVDAAVPVAMAKEERPQNKPIQVPVYQPQVLASNAGDLTDTGSMSALQQKSKQIRQQEQHLRAEQKQLLALKKEVEKKISTLLAIQKHVMLAQSQKQSAISSQIQGLSRIYCTMKPKQAAKLMGSLDDKLVQSIISTMPPNKAASILALMNVKKAAKISEALSGQN